MLNELSLVVEALDSLGIRVPSRHKRINPMGKNRDLLVISLDEGGKPSQFEVLPAETAASLVRVEHGSQGSSFPGFNLPAPLRRLEDVPKEDFVSAVNGILANAKNKNSTSTNYAAALRRLFELSGPQPFIASQEKQFRRSTSELVGELLGLLPRGRTDLGNLLILLNTVSNSNPTISSFAEEVARALVEKADGFDRQILAICQDLLFGALDWPKRTPEVGSPAYWVEKKKFLDKGANQPIYLDVTSLNPTASRVAHSETSAALNTAMIEAQIGGLAQPLGEQPHIVDAYGEPGPLQDKYPVGPKVAELGNVKLFSVNTNEVHALRRYGLEGSGSFPVSVALAQRMSDALLHLGNESKRGSTCRAIPSSQPEKRDLLVAYLEGEPVDRAPLAEMFGGETATFSEADFRAIAAPVLGMLEGKAAVNPSLNIRILSFSPIDKAKKQIGLNRRLRVLDVIKAARQWEAASRNAPEVSIWFFDKNAKRSIYLGHTVPCPLELATVINRVWGADAKSGFAASYQRAVSVVDAYDVFLGAQPFARQKSQIALGHLLVRMSTVLAKVGAVKTGSTWRELSEAVRWQCLKSVALLGILLHQLGHNKSDYMQEPVTQVGRLLALSDSLHLQYCKHVRKGETPSQLIGNALFTTALDQPVFAMARLAERLCPYQAWARTFQSDDPAAGVGLVKYFLVEIAHCAAAIQPGRLPDRMADSDKAKLLLGYLADSPKNETKEEQPAHPSGL